MSIERQLTDAERAEVEAMRALVLCYGRALDADARAECVRIVREQVESLVRAKGDAEVKLAEREEILDVAWKRCDRAEAALADAKADAESWHGQCEAARDLALKLGGEKDTAEDRLAHEVVNREAVQRVLAEKVAENARLAALRELLERGRTIITTEWTEVGRHALYEDRTNLFAWTEDVERALSGHTTDGEKGR